MKTIHIANDRKRDASVGIQWRRPEPYARYVLPDGRTYESEKFLRATMETDLPQLTKKYPSVADALVAGDPEIDIELFGRKLDRMRKVYVTPDGGVAYCVNLNEHVYDANGTEKQVRPYVEKQANLSLEEFPVRWTGKMFPKKDAIRKFVFSKGYQIYHVNGLTFDFLFDMAKRLHEADALMLVGGGEKGNGPLLIANNGSPYRGFLEGRVEGNRYQLVLRLTNMELKEVANA